MGGVARSGPGCEGEGAPDCGAILSDLCATVMVVEHRDRLAGFGVEHLEATLAVRGGGIMVADPGERTDETIESAAVGG